MKVFRYSHEKKSLSTNQKHIYALQKTFSIFESNSAYTFIPKNACSTLRYSIAKANGCIDDIKDIDWIHPNNQTFSMTTESAYQAKYRFVILRCPFSRIFSSFMDKMVNMDIQAWQYRITRGMIFHPHDLTFDWFIKDLVKTPTHLWDIHWRPQIDFLVYEHYDDIFCLENFSKAERTLKEKINLDIYDTRPFLGHEISSLKTDHTISSPSTVPALDLLLIKRSGIIPEAELMFTDELVRIMKNRYKDDIELYLDHFQPSPLMEKLL